MLAMFAAGLIFTRSLLVSDEEEIEEEEIEEEEIEEEEIEETVAEEITEEKTVAEEITEEKIVAEEITEGKEPVVEEIDPLLLAAEKAREEVFGHSVQIDPRQKRKEEAEKNGYIDISSGEVSPFLKDRKKMM